MTKTPSPNREPKKTTTIEVRVSDQAKAAFLDRCRARGRSASDTMREFMAAYAQSSGPGQNSWINKGLAMLKSPTTLIASLSAATLFSAGLLMLSPAAVADDVELTFEIAIDKPGEDQNVEASINLDYGRAEVFRLPTARDDQGEYFYEVSVLATPCAEQDRCAADNVLVNVAINRVGAGDGLVAEPRLLTKYGRGAAVRMSAAEGMSVRVEIMAERVRPAED